MRNKTEPKIISSELIGNLKFGQLHVFHEFSNNDIINNRISIRDIPHYKFLVNYQTNNNCKLYDDYLKISWKYYYDKSNNKSHRKQRQDKFIDLYNVISSPNDIEPVLVVTAPDGDKVLIDGNHRASIAYYKCLDLPYKEINIKNYLRSIVSNINEFYGTKHKGLPYQSIYYGPDLLLKGRRTDILERFCKIDRKDIRGKNVADIGSNLTITGMLAWYYGAISVSGYEFSKQIATAALRISTLLNSRLDMNVHDFNLPLKNGKRYETVFCFSLFAHVKNKNVLARNINKMTKNVLYFEGHERTKREDYETIFKYFKKVEFIGYNDDGIHSVKSTRPFFRCEK